MEKKLCTRYHFNYEEQRINIQINIFKCKEQKLFGVTTGKTKRGTDGKRKINIE